MTALDSPGFHPSPGLRCAVKIMLIRSGRGLEEVVGYHSPRNRAFGFSGTLLEWTRCGDDHDRPRIRLPLGCLFPEWGDDLRTLLLNTALPGCSDRLSAVR
jgi:hypothetical protein